MANQSPIIALAKYLPIVEGISVTAFAVGYIIKIMHYAGGNELVILSLSVLSGIYFLGAYVPSAPTSEAGEQKPKLGYATLLGSTVVPKILGIGLSVTVIGVLFSIMHFNGFREMLLIGSTSLAAATVVGWFVTSSDEQARERLKPLLMRAVVLMAVGFYLLNKYGISTPMN
jgi:hypothetical protein